MRCTTAAFSVVNAVLFRPLPYREPERLVQLWHSAPGLGMQQIEQSDASYVQYHDKTTRSFSSVASYQYATANLTGGQEPERVTSSFITASLIPTLGVQPMMGRLFTDEEERPGSPRVVMLSQSLWQRRFSRDPAIVGKTIQIDGISREIVGVMPASFHFPEQNTELWAPMVIDRANLAIDGQIAQHDRVAASAVAGEQCVDGVVDRLRHALTYRHDALADLRPIPCQAFFEPAHGLPNTRFPGGPLLTLDRAGGSVALVDDDALTLVGEDPVQVLFHAAFGLARRVHEKRPGDGITAIDRGFHRR